MDITLWRDPLNLPPRSNSQKTPDDPPTSSTEQGQGQKIQDGATPVPPQPSVPVNDRRSTPDQEEPM